jgi:hypothetical protein
MKKISLLLVLLVTLYGCTKYLDERPNKSMVVPSTLQDLQALLDNARLNNNFPPTVEIAADNIYLTDMEWQSRRVSDRNSYIWETDVFNDQEMNDWSLNYVSIYYANVVLSKLPRISGGTPEQHSFIAGQALFFRAYTYYHLLQVFAKPYIKETAREDLGIPLRLDPDPNLPTTRAKLEDCYTQILQDAKTAVSLLPNSSLVPTRPSRAAAYGLMARLMMTMKNYKQAKIYADSTLLLNDTLIDYNMLNPSSAQSFTLFNAEVIFNSVLYGSSALLPSRARIDSNLYMSYAPGDLRKELFFKNNPDKTISFKGSYQGNNALFSGLATDEIFLIRSEAQARLNNTSDALKDLNTLLQKRWKTGGFIPVTAIDATDALRKILTERRKELVLRGLRWHDLRRLNAESSFAVTLTRLINGTVYTLPPNDNRYTFPIPSNVINMTGIPQNPR